MHPVCKQEGTQCLYLALPQSINISLKWWKKRKSTTNQRLENIKCLIQHKHHLTFCYQAHHPIRFHLECRNKVSNLPSRMHQNIPHLQAQLFLLTKVILMNSLNLLNSSTCKNKTDRSNRKRHDQFNTTPSFKRLSFITYNFFT